MGKITGEPPDQKESSRQTTIIAMTGVVVVGLCALFTLTSQWLIPNASSLFDGYFPSPTPTRLPASTPIPTRTLIPNLTATQAAWSNPADPPSLGSAQEAGEALDLGVNDLEAFAIVVPDTPGINQPGDVYVYQVQLSESTPLLWNYGWCTTTQEILEENFSHIRLEFVVNGISESSDRFISHDYDRGDGAVCREYAAVVNEWPIGQHILESRITFTQTINDGWDVYPAGTHIFQYFVTVEQ